MIQVINTPGVSQGPTGETQKPRRVSRCAAFVGAGTISGVVIGAALGWLGNELLGPSETLPIFASLVIVAVILQIAKIPVLQYDRETPRSWTWLPNVIGPVLNGLALGSGGLTRLGSWFWYLVPAGAFLAADATLGAVIFGLYGLTRTLGSAILALLGERIPFTDLAVKVVQPRLFSIWLGFGGVALSSSFLLAWQ